MAIFNKKKNGGFIDVIRCDKPTYLIWKCHPGGTELGESKREYEIRTNSVLRVKNGEVAVFVYKQKDGTMQDYINYFNTQKPSIVLNFETPQSYKENIIKKIKFKNVYFSLTNA